MTHKIYYIYIRCFNNTTTTIDLLPYLDDENYWKRKMKEENEEVELELTLYYIFRSIAAAAANSFQFLPHFVPNL
jgi:hypothetical protein